MPKPRRALAVSAGPEERSFRGTNLPAGAIRLAAFELDPFGSGATVRARFAVPEVASGSYEVLICDDPCTIPGFGGYVRVHRAEPRMRRRLVRNDSRW